MKFTLSWLKQFLETDAQVEEIAVALTDLGLEAEEVINKKDLLKDFKVAYIKSVKPHPDAQKLQICEVETKEGTLQIVCGAPNARAGIKVALARIGAIIPSGRFKIKESEIRGVKSYGMLCSEEELEISKESSGIIELPNDAILGDEISKYFGLDDITIEINVTPNRADALGVYGIARELAAYGLGVLKNLEAPLIKADKACAVNLEVDSNICPLFAVREIKNIANVKSPLFLKNLLKNIGIKSISAVVDVTNYVCHSFGQPMHAYDASKVENILKIKQAERHQTFIALNDAEYAVEQGDIIICDDKNRIRCLAGIIGSKSSACDEDTQNIILEAAIFDAKNIAKTGQRLQINTDSRHRFERGVDHAFTMKALDIATDMILDICGGDASEMSYKSADKQDPVIINFPVNSLEKLAGFKIDEDKIIEILTSLKFKVTQIEENLHIEVPSWRHDIEIKEDIIEEVLRVYGYSNIPSIPLPEVNVSKIIPKYYKQAENIKRLLASCGYHEIVSWSFMKEDEAANFTKLDRNLKIINPISEELNYLRPSIIPNLLKAVSKNHARSIKNLALFEVGPIFNGSEISDENQYAAGIRCGDRADRSWLEKPKKIDAFDIKEDLEFIFSEIGLDFTKMQLKGAPDYYHPGRSCCFALGKNIIGYYGQIHPKIQKIFDISNDVYAFEINLNNLPLSKDKLGRKQNLEISDYQEVVRDFAFEVNASTNVGDILNFIGNLNKNLIKNVLLFDVYNKGHAGDTKSIALSVKIQARDHTLNEGEIADLSNLIINSVEEKFKAMLRR